MGKSSTQKTTSGPSSFAKPYIKGAANDVQSAFNSNQSNISNLSGILQSNLGAVTGNTFNNPTLGSANRYLQDELGGKFLNPSSNPGFASVLGQLNQSVTDQTNQGLGSRGLAGGSIAANLLSKNLANADGQLIYSNYLNERTNQNNAVTGASQVSAANTNNIGSLLNYIQLAAGLPQSGAATYADSISRLLGNSTTSTQTQSQGIGNSLMNAAGLGLAALSIPATGGGSALIGALSDRRLKTDVEKIGDHPDGLGVYRFRYLWDDPDQPPRAGVMADEVARLRPWALAEPIGDFQTVDYSRL